MTARDDSIATLRRLVQDLHTEMMGVRDFFDVNKFLTGARRGLEGFSSTSATDWLTHLDRLLCAGGRALSGLQPQPRTSGPPRARRPLGGASWQRHTYRAE